MRFISGVLLGIVLTFGTAYLVDLAHGAPGPGGHSGRPLVNWDVVGDDVRGLSSDVQALWARLVGDAKKLNKQVEKQNNG